MNVFHVKQDGFSLTVLQASRPSGQIFHEMRRRANEKPHKTAD